MVSPVEGNRAFVEKLLFFSPADTDCFDETKQHTQFIPAVDNTSQGDMQVLCSTQQQTYRDPCEVSAAQGISEA
jgi:hypothetical protein